MTHQDINNIPASFALSSPVALVLSPEGESDNEHSTKDIMGGNSGSKVVVEEAHHPNDSTPEPRESSGCLLALSLTGPFAEFIYLPLR
ncbi:hypothetical protein Nepgr_006528 [Nepenthes gracilis]|uniref:Uncharacterized protein n=1 Tax=Nepenthes gracilis TaxID=150966 RepID=A0AAD3S5B4_NEPGR|nr:hypothetical protein Nepgr_006528 [Nepenthes gracilis]